MPELSADAPPVAKSFTTILQRAMSAVFCVRTQREVKTVTFSPWLVAGLPVQQGIARPSVSQAAEPQSSFPVSPVQSPMQLQ